MTIGKYLTGGAWAAMAAALALTAMPASAAPENMGRNWDRGSSARGEARAARQERSGGERASPRQAAMPRRPRP